MGAGSSTPSTPVKPVGGAAPSPAAAPAAPEQKPRVDRGDRNEVFQGFDPRGLERAAKAAKELEASALGKEAIALSKEQEKTFQLEAQGVVEENKAKAAAYAIEQARVAGDERRKSVEAEQRAQQQAAYYQDQLNRKRHQDQLAAQAAQHQQDIKRQEESAMRVESLRRETAAYEAQLRKETEVARAVAEADAKAKADRANFDLTLERSKLEAKEFRTTVMDAVRETGTIVGEGFKNFITDGTRVTATVGALTALALGVYSARSGTALAGRVIESRLGKPPLVRETSRIALRSAITHPFRTVGQLFSRNRAAPGEALKGVVLKPELKTRLENLAVSTANTKLHNAPFRNVLLHGPPGTGKTLFARKLAQASGMDYAIITGGDVAPLGRDAVAEIHKLFDWAATSKKGLLLFVDEADAFLRKRSAGAPMSEDARNALNAFLYRTGSERKDFMAVFATNLPQDLDFAVTDRADETVEFALPGQAERLTMLKMYFERNVLGRSNDAGEAGKSGGIFSRSATRVVLAPEVNVDATLAEIAEKTAGFSGREISKLTIAMQAAAFASKDAILTKEMIDRVVADRVDTHAQKFEWLAQNEKAVEKRAGQ